MYRAALILLFITPFELASQVVIPVDSARDVRVENRTFAVLVPHGWKPTDPRLSNLMLEHTSGASFSFMSLGSRRNITLDATARQGLDRVMRPLGFATSGGPLQRKVNGAPAIQYVIRGNRLSDRRKLLYVAIERDDGMYEMVYENSEADFDLLLAEAERIGESVELRAISDERLVVTRIRLVNTAEAVYRRTHERYGTLADIIAANLLVENSLDADSSYRVRLVISGDGYRIEATPGNGSGRWSFESDQTGVVRYSSRRGMAPAGMLGRPVQ